MAEAKGEFLQQTVDRRGLLRNTGRVATGLAIAGIIGVGADSAASHLPDSGPLGFSRNFWEGLESGTLGQSPEPMARKLQNEFGVVIVSPQDDLEAFNITEIGTVTGWKSPQMEAVSDILGNLPPTFYQPREINGKLLPLAIASGEVIPEKIISKDPDSQDPHVWKRIATCRLNTGDDSYANADYSGVIIFDNDHIRQNFLLEEKSDLLMVHELTHNATVPKLPALLEKLMSAVGTKDEERLKEILNVPEYNSNMGIIPQTHAKLKYGSENYREFYAVAGEFFYQGREKFVKTYSSFFGEERAQQLYDHVKDDVFEGREY